jgi:hypothetical protein
MFDSQTRWFVGLEDTPSREKSTDGFICALFCIVATLPVFSKAIQIAYRPDAGV